MNDSPTLSRSPVRRFAMVAILAGLAVLSSRYFRPAWAVQGQDAARQHSPDPAGGERNGGQATGEGVPDQPQPNHPQRDHRGGLRLPENLDEIPAGPDSQSGPPEALERIRSRLRGEGPRSPTGDGTLDDILRLIDGQGSILDGSSLELPKRRVAASPDTAATTRRARAAEALLRAARLLERERRLERESGSWHDGQTPADGPPAADDLVHRMRAEAVRLLERPADRQRRSGIDPSFEKHPSDEPF